MSDSANTTSRLRTWLAAVGGICLGVVAWLVLDLSRGPILTAVSAGEAAPRPELSSISLDPGGTPVEGSRYSAFMGSASAVEPNAEAATPVECSEVVHPPLWLPDQLASPEGILADPSWNTGVTSLTEAERRELQQIVDDSNALIEAATQRALFALNACATGKIQAGLAAEGHPEPPTDQPPGSILLRRLYSDGKRYQVIVSYGDSMALDLACAEAQTAREVGEVRIREFMEHIQGR